MERLAIVTGASRGIGKSLAAELLLQDWTVLGIARGPQSVMGSSYIHASLDLSRLPEAVLWFETEFLKHLGPASVDLKEVVLVNNSGSIGTIQRLWDHSAEQLSAEFTLNTILPIWLMGFVVRQFPEVPIKVINLSSGAAQQPYEGWTTYCSTKASLLMASRVFAGDSRSTGARRSVVSFAPGSVDTEMQRTIRQAKPEVFPKVEKFRRLEEEQLLFPVDEIATSIVQIAEQETLPDFLNLRYKGAYTVRCLECGSRLGIKALEHDCASCPA